MKLRTPGAEGKRAINGLMERSGFSRDGGVARALRIAEGDSGAELLEFALVVPLLLTLLMGIVWIGRAYNVYSTITRAAREGARYAALPSSVAAGNAYADKLSKSCSSKTNSYSNDVVPVLESENLNPNSIQGYCQKTGWLESTYPKQCGVIVSFSYPVKLQIPFTSVNATTIDIPAEAQMRLEDQPAGGQCPQ